MSAPDPNDEQQRQQWSLDDAADATDAVNDVTGGGGCEWPSCDNPCDGFDGCGGCGGCDSNLLRVSSLLLVAAAVVPDSGGFVRALIRLYQRLLTRFTPRCPSTPSCSSYALTAVETLGARHGLRAAARRIRGCGRPVRCEHRPR